MDERHESRNLFLHGPAGRLEAIFWQPSGAAASIAALVCHPHPLFGGTMHNKVVYQAAKSLDALGLAVLRFNFRGAGMSAGTHDKGIGEREDVRAALNFLDSELPNAPILLVGFSFGCWVGLRVGCEEEKVKSLIGLGAPVNHSDFSYLARCEKPKLFVQGGNDQFGEAGKLRSMTESLPGENRVVFVENADHFFTGKLDRLDAAITEWLKERHPYLLPR